MNIEEELKSICKTFKIKINESRYYVNESIWYGFETQENMLIVAAELIKTLTNEPVPFKITLHNEEVPAIEIFETDL